MFRRRTLRPRGTYTDWFWPGKGYAWLEHLLTAEIDPGPHTTYFWAHQFRTEAGEGGYIGLQTRGNRVDGSLGKMAIFSFWNTLGAEGPGITRFGGEGEGWSCRIPFLWEPGRPYRLAVREVADDGRTRTWAAEVDGEEFGRIHAPAAWGRLGAWSVMWTEYYGGPLARCADLPYSRVVFSTPAAGTPFGHGAGTPFGHGAETPSGHGAGTVRPYRSHDHLGDGDCGGSRVTRITDGRVEVVRHEMGSAEIGDG